MQKMQNNNIYEKKGEYDPSKYLPDPEHPEFVCPIEDQELPNRETFEMHIIANHDLEDMADALANIEELNWKYEKLIRRLTGKQGIEIILEEDLEK